jgi:hypothetical protein
LASSSHLQPSAASALKTAANAAFTHGLDWAAGASAVLMILAALLSIGLLRRLPRAPEHDAAAAEQHLTPTH